MALAMSSTCITLASYNMHKAVGLDGRRDPHRVLDVLQEIDADIVALQEADRRFGGRGSTVPHELIDSHGMYKPVHLGVKHKRVFDKARKHTDRLLKVNTRNIGWHGNAILVKQHVGVLDCAALDLPTLEPRGAVIAELLIDDQPIRVVGMHLDLSGLWRERQMRAILSDRPAATADADRADGRHQRMAHCSGLPQRPGERVPDRADRAELPRAPPGGAARPHHRPPRPQHRGGRSAHECAALGGRPTSADLGAALGFSPRSSASAAAGSTSLGPSPRDT